MKFTDYKNIINESLRDSIDDSDVLNVLSKYSIYNDRTKLDSGELLYKFDNRYSLKYDGSVFTLYRHGDRVHYASARNLKEIDDNISKWLESYSLDSIEVTDDGEDDIKDLINKITGTEEPDTTDDDKSDDDKSDDETKDDTDANKDDVESGEVEDKTDDNKDDDSGKK